MATSITCLCSGNVPIDHSKAFCEGISCIRWITGAVGATLATCAIVLAILGLVQPDWFVGTIGNPNAWALWVISGGTFALGGGFIAYAIFSQNKAKTTASLG